jgi:hypothetical protein
VDVCVCVCVCVCVPATEGGRLLKSLLLRKRVVSAFICVPICGRHVSKETH